MSSVGIEGKQTRTVAPSKTPWRPKESFANIPEPNTPGYLLMFLVSLVKAVSVAWRDSTSGGWYNTFHPIKCLLADLVETLTSAVTEDHTGIKLIYSLDYLEQRTLSRGTALGLCSQLTFLLLIWSQTYPYGIHLLYRQQQCTCTPPSKSGNHSSALSVWVHSKLCFHISNRSCGITVVLVEQSM